MKTLLEVAEAAQKKATEIAKAEIKKHFPELNLEINIALNIHSIPRNMMPENSKSSRTDSSEWLSFYNNHFLVNVNLYSKHKNFKIVYEEETEEEATA